MCIKKFFQKDAKHLLHKIFFSQNIFMPSAAGLLLQLQKVVTFRIKMNRKILCRVIFRIQLRHSCSAVAQTHGHRWTILVQSCPLFSDAKCQFISCSKFWCPLGSFRHFYSTRNSVKSFHFKLSSYSIYFNILIKVQLLFQCPDLVKR